MRALKAHALLVLASVATALAGAEGFLRVANLQVTDWAYNTRKYGRLVTYDEAGGFTRHLAGGRGVAHGVSMRFNSHGMRDREHAFEKPAGTCRVLVLGDSVTVGLGERFEDIYPQRLEALLNQNGASPGPVEVIAAAVAGWNTMAERNYLRAEGLRFHPDLVLLLYVTNDNEIALPWAPRPPPAPLEQAWQWLASKSRLVELASFAYRQRWPAPPDPNSARMLTEISRAAAARQKQPHMFEPDDPGWLASRAALEDIARMTRSQGIGFVVVLFNLGGPDGPTVTARLGEFAASTGVEVVDAYPWFADRPITSLVNSRLHPNSDGHAILAEHIAQLFAAEDLLH